ncbi:MAG: DNA helicase RecQ [Acidobacteriota bacterium]|jgi:ATP-dependent DNA helicase RecQ|nr:DNA helicase RecQ [Acidobacteriota bacterium]
MDGIEGILKRYWGYSGFRPLQREAMECVLAGRDSIVVLPTGGGKSLCFQVPALALPGLTLVISPLISLMKDQLDALTECGVAAGRLDSSMSSKEKAEVFRRLDAGELKLLYVSPERLLMEGFLDSLKARGVSSVAIDEAHCVSMWGHDFRPEYRKLRVLRQALPGVPVGAYTATATGQVRGDIAAQLLLDSPETLVGDFDRPNLIYRCRRRTGAVKQIREVLDRHPKESGIVYCIRRTDVDETAQALAGHGYRVAPYHAGMSDAERKASQDAFIREDVDVIVATVAFGMGIDKSNVRYVVHAGMPKSLEHYQQESGRAGRDGLDAECVLLYSGGDYRIWRSIIEESEPQTAEVGLAKLSRMYRYCTSVGCRHRTLLEYFGQGYAAASCRACDICLGEVEGVPDALVIAQKILSSVVRQQERFGADYTAGVLVGSREDRIVANRHDRLSTYGLLKEATRPVVRDWIEQLAEQEYLARVGEYNVLKLTEKGLRALRGEETPLLLEAPKKKSASKKPFPDVKDDSWAGVDKALFEALRQLRRRLAAEGGVPAYVIFGDATLRDLARRRPVTKEALLQVSGVGLKKLDQYGDQILGEIKRHL